MNRRVASGGGKRDLSSPLLTQMYCVISVRYIYRGRIGSIVNSDRLLVANLINYGDGPLHDLRMYRAVVWKGARRIEHGGECGTRRQCSRVEAAVRPGIWPAGGYRVGHSVGVVPLYPRLSGDDEILQDEIADDAIRLAGSSVSAIGNGCGWKWS